MTNANFSAEWGFNTNIEKEFLEGQQALTIRIKDGYKFFKANKEIFKKLFADAAKQITIIILHPDSPHVAAVASMDNNKTPVSQQNDDHWAVQLLQEIRKELITEGRGDCAERVIFRGADDVPTTVAFIGDREARMDVYQSHAYRGPLMRFTGYIDDPMQKDATGKTRNLYTTLKDECGVLVEQTQPERNNLWKYTLPDPLLDLRR